MMTRVEFEALEREADLILAGGDPIAAERDRRQRLQIERGIRPPHCYRRVDPMWVSEATIDDIAAGTSVGARSRSAQRVREPHRGARNPDAIPTTDTIALDISERPSRARPSIDDCYTVLDWGPDCRSRDSDVLIMLCANMSTAEIARHLGRSARTAQLRIRRLRAWIATELGPARERARTAGRAQVLQAARRTKSAIPAMVATIHSLPPSRAGRPRVRKETNDHLAQTFRPVQLSLWICAPMESKALASSRSTRLTTRRRIIKQQLAADVHLPPLQFDLDFGWRMAA